MASYIGRGPEGLWTVLPSRLRPGPAAGSLVISCVCSQGGLGGVWIPRKEVSHWLHSPYYLIGSPRPRGLEGHDFHDLAKNYRGHHPATELCRRGIRDEQGPRRTSKGRRLHGPPHHRRQSHPKPLSRGLSPFLVPTVRSSAASNGRTEVLNLVGVDVK